MGAGKLGSVLIRQKYRRFYVGPDEPDTDGAGYKRVKAGKEYWLPLIEGVRVCRRSNTIWGFEHLCGNDSWEMRSRKKDKYMQCIRCQGRFDSRQKLTELAKATYPDIDTVKFVAGLARLYGD